MKLSPPLAGTGTTAVSALLLADAAIAIGVSGGKDGAAAALAVTEYLDDLGHRGPRILIHSDLGRVEHKDSLPSCERLAQHLGLELVVVRRQSGDMMDRWQQRWRDNLVRYINLECVKIIMPWSSSAMRFCTSELKTSIIWRELARRFQGQQIVSVTGIRADESPKRARAATFKPKTKINGEQYGTRGYDWLPIHSWTLGHVLDIHERHGLPLHEAYTRYGNTRVSCSYCILSSQGDLRASASNPDNHDIYREMVDLEIQSTFSFQDSGWLADIAPYLLTPKQRQELEHAKKRAAFRAEVEARIPAHLLYEAGWPTTMPTFEEARLLAQVRKSVALALGITQQMKYTTALDIHSRYRELMEAKADGPA